MTRRVLLMISSMRGGGSEQQTLLLLKHLDRSRFTPHLYLLNRVGELLDAVPKDVCVHAFDDQSFESSFYFPGRILRHQVRHLKQILTANSIDVVYDRTFHMSMIAGQACKAEEIPRVSTIVSPPHHALPLVEQRFVSLKRRRLRQAYHDSYQVLAVSRVAADSAESYYSLPAGSVEVVPNPVEIVVPTNAKAVGDKSSAPCVTFVCVGRMTAEKGHSDLIDAARIAQQEWTSDRPFRILMVGDGPLRSDLERQASEIASPHRIEFIGRKNDVAPIIATSDALVLPSHFEGMPNVVLESMALATPVIATRAGGTVELEREEPTVLWAEPRNPRSIAKAMLDFATNPTDAERRVSAATQLVRDHHDVTSTTRRIEKYLERACVSTDT